MGLCRGLLPHRDFAMADQDGIDTKWRSGMAQPCPRNQFVYGSEIA
jgi:hypothetical protein